MSALASSEPELASIDALVPGVVIGGRYEIVDKLGEGGMGAVFSARHTGLDRRVAVKVLRSELANNTMFITRFRHEARTAAAVRHLNIVEVIDFGNDGPLCYLVMEHLQGESLQSLIDRQGPLDPGFALRLVDPVMAALAHAHSLGVLHRDIKPDNVFLARIPGADAVVPKLLDFGIARRAIADDEVRITASGVMLGTPAYMAPEQAWGQKDLTPSADQWSIAATLYECLAGRLPHEAANFNELIIRRVTEDPTPLRDLRPDLDPDLCAVVMRALAREPSERFDSIDALRDALAPFCERAPRAAPDPVGHSLVPGRPTAPHGPPVPGDVGLADTQTELLAPAVTPVTPVALDPVVPAPVEPAPVEAPAPPVEAPTPPVIAVGAVSVPPPAVPDPARPSTSLAWRVGAIALVGIGLVGGMSRFASRSTNPTANAPPHALSPPPPPPPSPAVRESVTFAFDFQPPTAVITLDGERLGTGRASVQRPRSQGRLQLRVEAPDCEVFLDVLPGDRDVSVARALSCRTAAAAPPVARPHTSGHQAPSNPGTPHRPGQRAIDTRWVP